MQVRATRQGQIIKQDRYSSNPTRVLISNMVAIIGNIFWLIHDWLYTEQYLSACFYMPIAISIFEDTEPEDLLDPSLSSIDKKAQKKQNQARWALWILRGIYYTILALYVILGSFSTRLQFN